MIHKNSPTGAVVTTTLTAFLTCTSIGLAADGPASFDGIQLPLDAIGVLEVPGPDYFRLWAQDSQQDDKGTAMRIAVPNAVSVTPATHGTWERMPDGRMLWRLIVVAEGSKHLNLGFEDWELPPSGEAWIASEDGRWILNQITPADNINEGELWTAVVFSDRIIVEIAVDEHERNILINNTTLTKVNAGYRGFGTGDGSRGSSESCNVDVVCSLGDDWWDEIPACGVYTVQGFLTCTGAMINNTNLDETPYFLTADHCGIANNNDQTVVVYWNHQNSYCRTPGSGDSGGNGNGNFNQYTSGSTHLVSGGNSDYCLIEMNSDPNPVYEISFSGWNRSSSTPSVGMGIHQPNCAEKRISSVQNIYSTGPYWGVNWDEGRTYFGSSGSPLYDGNHRIVGQLYGGNSFCTNDQDDVYGKLSNSWSALSQYLDPNGSGVMTLDTLNPYGDGGNGGVCCLLENCYNVTESTCNSSNGTWYADQNCGDVDCSDPDPTGACCIADGSCTSGTSQDCNGQGGTYQGDGTSCGSVNCPQPDPVGACCTSSGNCTDGLTAAECSGVGGTWQGQDTDCDFVDCGGSGEYADFNHAIVGTNKVSGSQDNWTVDVFVTVDQGNRVDAVAGNSVQQKLLTSTYGFYQDANGGPTSGDINPSFYDFVPDLEWDSRVTIGALDMTGNPFDENNIGDVGIDWTTFENGGNLSVSNGTWYILPVHEQGEAQLYTAQDCSQQYGVLIARLTAMELNSSISIEALVQGRDAGGNNWQDTVDYTFTYEASEDCNDNLVPDSCDIANGTSDDTNGDGIPDECDDACPGDADGDGDSDVDDILLALGNFGSSGGGDVNGDGIVDVNDLLQILAYYNSC